MEASRASFRCEFSGVPYVVRREVSAISDQDTAWLLDNVFDAGDPVADLVKDPLELFHSLYLGHGVLTETSASLEAPWDLALLARHALLQKGCWRVAAPPPGAAQVPGARP